ncbi:tRNA (cytosine-5-)-methyltransferase ncl1 [Elasticomyces elasticus]|nr:tRNA (cytosine-5-)-methyltransferase ncl1 [Elasticomyces elasticus]KAK4979834.1 tRNA (cytosine-5-)-methyltransferase ncl1 [Elasticomyces elasticus]
MARGNFRGGRGGGGGRGRGRGGGRGRGRGGGNRGGGGGQDNRVSFDQIPKQNDKLERFYNTLNIVPEGPERDAFWTALRRELPNSFRFTGSKGHALSVRQNLVDRFFPVISQIKHEGKPVDLPYSMPWYPEGLAYSMTTPKHVVRKYEPFKDFQKWLVSETGVGNISRQEQVSMIPPLVLDVRPEHTVLDLCAAPGSKSAQLIEAVHAGEEDRVARAIKNVKNGVSDGDGENMQDQGRATGLLVANDVNYQRAQMLVHQVKRLNSPNLIVMNHDATMFPSIELPSQQTRNGTGPSKYLKFDRILADVPCSGDGTCRKNPAIWKEWSPQNGLGLYITQVRILVRALQMLKVGGRVVYSTCSMNPVEDEAVISSAIERCGGMAKVDLLDSADMLPGLVRSTGLTDWSIMSRTGQIYESWPEAEQYEAEGSKIVPGMFAPDVEEKIPLQHCMRVYPHQQDTGGFFIAVLEKKAEIRAKPENESKCFDRKWRYTGDGEQNTAFGELLADVASEPVDAHGHLHKSNGEPALPDAGEMSAAQRSNEPIEAGIKRKADELDEDGSLQPKRSRMGDEPAESTMTADTTRKEHYPLPPAVAMAVEADGGVPLANAEGLDSSQPQETEANDAVEDAADNAPFTPSVPAEAQAPPMRQRNRDNQQRNVEAFVYLDPKHAELESIYAFYKLHSSFPRDRFLVRNPAGDPVKGIYYSSQLAKDILSVNAEGKGMKFVHAGVKMFMKQDVQGQAEVCRWRIQTEGLPIVEGWVGEEREVRLWKRATLRKLLVEMFPKVGGPEGQEGWRELGEIGEAVRDLGMGCCVLRVEPRKGDPEGFEESLVLPLWRSLHSLNLMLPKEDRKAMLLRIFEEDVELVNHSDPAQSQQKGKGQGGAQGDTRGGASGSKVSVDVMSNEHKASAIKEEDRPHANGNAQGSMPGEEDSKRLAEITAQTTDFAGVVEGEPIDPKIFDGVLDDNAREEQLNLSAQALEADGEAKRDSMEAAKLEEQEDDGVKLMNAMPEREGETDEMNTTV